MHPVFIKWLYFLKEGRLYPELATRAAQGTSSTPKLVVFDNVETITCVLKQFQIEEFVVSAAALGGLAFYQVEHIN
ncbi:MAG: Tn3 family transposase [Polaromonas sp.]|nr:Tn3 family transposase [Polaromonas sp.]